MHRPLLLSATLFALFVGLSVHAQSNTTLFTADLKVGMYHPQVLELQKVLNRDPVTRISATGPGSPGQETSYFGQLTKQAVIRFQEKNASRVLAPAGLSAGTGFVGAGTRALLNELEAAPAPQVSTPAPAPAIPAPSINTSSTTSANPNAAQIGNFVAAVDALGKKQGMDPSKLVAVEQAMRTIAATTTDLKMQFLLHANIKPASSIADSWAPQGFGQRILSMLGLYTPARAGLGVGFGGALLSAIPCTCAPDVWLIFLEPLPPSYAAILSYAAGTQLFASYNTPLTTHLLGIYEPGAPVCWMYVGVACAPPPQEGYITPQLGSAPL